MHFPKYGGIESEYIVIPADYDCASFGVTIPAVYKWLFREKADKHARLNEFFRDEISSHHFLPNAGRFYIDNAYNPEYCTPLALDAREVARNVIAGDYLMAEAAEQFRESIQIYARLRGPLHSEMSGLHINILTGREALGHFDSMAKIATTFVSMTPIMGAGLYMPNGRFVVSQRSTETERVISGDTFANRPIYNTRDEPLSNSEIHRRIHSIHADRVRSETQIALTFFCMQARIFLNEADRLPSGFQFKEPGKGINPVDQFREIGADPDLKATLDLKVGKVLPLDLELLLWQELKRYVGQNPSFTKFFGGDEAFEWGMEVWADTIFGLSLSDSSSVNWIDWRYKKTLGDAMKTKREDDNLNRHKIYADLMAFDQNWASLTNDRVFNAAVRKQLQQATVAGHQYYLRDSNEADLLNALLFPPLGRSELLVNLWMLKPDEARDWYHARVADDEYYGQLPADLWPEDVAAVQSLGSPLLKYQAIRERWQHGNGVSVGERLDRGIDRVI